MEIIIDGVEEKGPIVHQDLKGMRSFSIQSQSNPLPPKTVIREGGGVTWI